SCGLNSLSTSDKHVDHQMLKRKLLVLPLAFASALAGLALLAPVRNNPNLPAAFAGAALAILVWNALLFLWVGHTRKTLRVDVVLKKQHYLQACGQGVILMYWVWYWPQVYQSFLLILAQLIFAYAVDILLSWSRRDTYVLGFAPFPVIFSINLFLWFK